MARRKKRVKRATAATRRYGIVFFGFRKSDRRRSTSYAGRSLVKQWGRRRAGELPPNGGSQMRGKESVSANFRLKAEATGGKKIDPRTCA